MITTTDPRTGESSPTTIEATDAASVSAIAALAADAFRVLRTLDRARRAELLDAIADELEADRAGLVSTAMRETGLPQARLDGELTRSACQFRLFAEAVRDGGYLEATIDHAGPTPMGPGPELRRMLVPIGPVAVFGSSNFPFAFSVAGGDTASALAAGNPVIAKAHSSHLETSRRSYDALRTAASRCGFPGGAVGIVYGQAAGAQLVAAPEIRAVGFTGSKRTGETLMEIIAGRERPIPFFGELSSLNPLIVTPGAARDRSAAIAQGLFDSVTASGGQLCTKPGIAFVPRSAEALRATLEELIGGASSAALLNERIADSFARTVDEVVGRGARMLARGQDGGPGFSVPPTLLGVDATDLTPSIAEEVFGPLVVLAFYDDPSEIAATLDAIPDSLSASIHSAPDEADLRQELADELADRVGRIVFDGYTTGVRVAWAQHHGGPWPATNTQHTSVGVRAIRRFLRPFVWQDAPAALLPSELQDGDASILRRVDGRVILPEEARPTVAS